MQDNIDEFIAKFAVRGFTCAPGEITAAIGLEPDVVEVAGEVRIVRRREPQKTRPILENAWILRSPAAASGQSSVALRSLLARLAPVADRVKDVARKYDAAVTIVGYCYGGNPGLHLDGEQIGRLADMGLSLDVDLYCLEYEDK